MTTKDLLYKLAIQANNVIMKGEYTGDAMIEAVSTMQLCHKIVKAINDEKIGADSKGSSGTSES